MFAQTLPEILCESDVVTVGVSNALEDVNVEEAGHSAYALRASARHVRFFLANFHSDASKRLLHR